MGGRGKSGKGQMEAKKTGHEVSVQRYSLTITVNAAITVTRLR
jgi:hypothetical protein